ncbi:MAG: hypothetical protein AAFR91_01310 [Pseudomonadota bacterium]
MKYVIIPSNYEAWRHCITVECVIPLTADFVATRLKVWNVVNVQVTARFRALYGDTRWRAVIGWFERASRELQLRHETPPDQMAYRS